MDKDRTRLWGGESYVLRLYRREEASDQAFIGLLEDPLRGLQWSFRSLEELKELLKAKTQATSRETETGEV